jgi:hypothetical protein
MKAMFHRGSKSFGPLSRSSRAARAETANKTLGGALDANSLLRETGIFLSMQGILAWLGEQGSALAYSATNTTESFDGDDAA